MYMFAVNTRPDSLLRNTSHTHLLVQNFKILGPVVPEKSLMEKKLHIHKHTHIVMKKTKTTYPLYTLYARGIIKSIFSLITTLS